MTLTGAGRGGPQGPFNATDHRPKKGESIAMGLHLMMMQRELLNFQYTLAESFPTTKDAEFPGRIAFVRYVPTI